MIARTNLLTERQLMARIVLPKRSMRVTACLLAALISLPFTRTASAQSDAAVRDDAADAWRERYTRARGDLVEGRYQRAERELIELAKIAPTPADAARALDLADLARASRMRAERTGGPHVRTSDELSVLYTSAFIYGLGTLSESFRVFLYRLGIGVVARPGRL